MMTMSTAEKIETVAQCRSTGTLGEFVEYEPGRYRVTCDGLTVLVRGHRIGWAVSFKGFEAIDAELFVAARNALEAGRARNCTKHADLAAELGV